MKDKNKILFKEAEKYFPGGVSSPVRAFKAVGGVPKFFRKAYGAYFEDEEGCQYLDLCMSWGPLILGHSNRKIINAAKEAMEEGFTFGAPSRREIELAYKIKSMVPFLEKMRFVSSGTEAVMSAIRTARGFTKRDRILKFDGCYHGHCDSLLVRSGSGSITFNEPSSAGIPSVYTDLTIVIPLDNIELMEAIFLRYGNELAAAIIEPIPANNGLLIQDKDFLIQLRRLCSQHGVVLIFDEVITGFRVAPGGASELFDITPDIATYGKIIGGGMPVGLYGGRNDIMSTIAPNGPVYQAGTLSGNPVAMAAGLATLEQLTPDVYIQLQQKGILWSEVFSELPDLQVSCLGSIIWPKFQSNIKCASEISNNAITKFNEMHRLLLKQGIYLPPSGFEVSFLSTAHNYEELNFFKKAIHIVKNELSNK